MINDYVKPGEKCGLCYARDLSPYVWAFFIGLLSQKVLPDYAIGMLVLLSVPFLLAPVMSDLHTG